VPLCHCDRMIQDGQVEVPLLQLDLLASDWHQDGIDALSHIRMSAGVFLAASLFLTSAARADPGGETEARWIGSWTASQQRMETGNALDPADLRDATLRQIVHLSLGGSQIRLRLSNRFGAMPLRVMAVHLARPASPDSDKIVAGTDQAVTFAGSPQVTIPPHADYISDPAPFPISALSDVAITLHIDAPPEEQTGHPGSRATSYFTHGDLVSALEFPAAKTVEHWYFIAGIDVAAPPEAASVVVLGDSITDGRGATTNRNNRWTDILAQRLQAEPTMRHLAVLNQGIGGNRLLADGLGPNALSRLDHDVIAQSGVRCLIVLEGINDIGMLARSTDASLAEHHTLVERILAAYQQIISRAHMHDIKVIGATLLPFAGSNYYHAGPASEADRQAVNAWIRTLGHFDAVIDFDKITRDPERPVQLLPAFDSGDHLHPSPAGYLAMAQSVPLSLLAASRESRPTIAITFDDLPAHGSLPSGESRMEVAAKIIAALRDANLPPVFGFVIGLRLEEQPADAAVLEAWHSAGNWLGNQTWSHMNLNQHPLEEFGPDVLRDESVLASVMKKEDWHWFRYPFPAEGDTPAKKAGFRDFLRQHGYRVAAVTMSFGDYLWNEPYVRCKAKGDAAALATLETSYLTAAQESIDYYRGLSHTLYQRDIPYVLVMHVGAFDAKMLPQLLRLYRAGGFHFVTLAEAENDEFYRNLTSLDLPPGPETLEEAMQARQLPLPAPTDFNAKLDSLCR
jgi:lysophospholipase L1-like esterase